MTVLRQIYDSYMKFPGPTLDKSTVISTMNALSASALEPHVDTQFGDIFQFGEFDSAKMT